VPRTTLNLDAVVLSRLRQRQRRDRRSLGEIASELIAHGLSLESEPAVSGRLDWTSAPMEPRIDLEDKDAVRTALDAS